MNKRTQGTSFGVWGDDSHGLPVFSYTGPLPCVSDDPTDPFFLLGNYRLTAFVHASGRIMLFSTDRAFARLNPGKTEAEGASAFHLELETGGRREELILTGLDSAPARAAGKEFGCGFARFRYAGLPGGLELTRTLATLPSANWTGGCPSLLIELELVGGKAPVNFALSDTVDAAYDMGFWHNFPCRIRRASYPATAEALPDGGVAVRFTPVEEMPLVLGDEAEDPGYADRFPARLRFVPIASDGCSVTPVLQPGEKDAWRVGLHIAGALTAGERRRIRYVLAIVRSEAEAQDAAQQLVSAASDDASFRSAWSNRLPAFVHDADAGRRQELRWHAYTLHAMATWSDFTKTTFIPQGNLYEYALGTASCLRDHMQHGLPACYYDADLARSIIRFAVRKTNVRGHVQGEDEGAGLIAEGTDKKSDNQIYALQLLAEYLLAQRDGAFLAEQVQFFDGGRSGTVLDRAERWFRFLRDVVGIGPHGHIRVLRSDWNDNFHDFFPNRSYADIIWNGESLLNTAQAIVVLERLAKGLEVSRSGLPDAAQQARLDRFVTALRAYRAELLPPLLALIETRDWCPKARVGDEIFGDDPIVLEPQGWVLLIPEIPLEKRRRILNTVRSRLLDGEKKGARVLSSPLPWFKSSPPWTRDNGGIWFALNGPLTMGALEIEPEFGRDLLERMTLRRHAREFPYSWPGTWTAPDCVNSSRASHPGGADHYTRMFPAFCAHAHAWPLYLALLANENA